MKIGLSQGSTMRKKVNRAKVPRQRRCQKLACKDTSRRVSEPRRQRYPKEAVGTSGAQAGIHLKERGRTSNPTGGLQGGSLDLEAKSTLRKESGPQGQRVFRGESQDLGGTDKDPPCGGSQNLERKCETSPSRKEVSSLDGLSEI